MVDRVRLDGYNGVKQNLLKMKLFKLKLLIKNMENMKKLLFLLMVAFACFQVNAQDDFSTKNYIEQWGRLKIVNKQICDQNGNPVQLRGWSTFGLQWTTDCYSPNSVDIMKGWGANSVRVAMYVNEGGYENNPSGFIAKVKDFIDWTANTGIYCVVDWHTLTNTSCTSGTRGYSDDPNKTLNERMANGQGAEYFFENIAKYVSEREYKHVIYELCNEPNNCSWSNVKTYASKVIPYIQNNDKNALMIVGTPQWCQLVDNAIGNEVDNGKWKDLLLYSFHYYACSHLDFLPKLQKTAASVPVVVSEWGAVNFNGDQKEIAPSNGLPYDFEICDKNSDQLMSVCDGNNQGNLKISWWMWNWGNKREGSSSLASCSNITNDKLLASGRYILTKLCGDGTCVTPVPATEGPYGGKPQPIPTPDGGTFEIAHYDLGGEGLAYHDGNGDEDDPNNYEATTNCNVGVSYANKDEEGNPIYSFRLDEEACVDVSQCAGVDGSWTSWNLCNRENDEWMKYTVEVEEPGYYSFEYQSNPVTSGTVSFSLEKPISTGGTQPLGNCMYTSGTEDEIPYVTFDSYDDLDGCGAETWLCWEWDKPLGAKSPSLLFREAGTFIITMLFPTEGGDLGPFRFTKAASYSGAGYPAPDATSIADAASADFVIYPNPTTGEINIDLADADEAEVNIINVMGQIVYSSKIESGAKINAGLVKGTYIVTVKTANSVAQQKLVVE